MRLLIPVFLMLAACSSDNGAEMQKAVAYLSGSPTASSTDGMTFGQPGYWQTECRGNTALWKAAVTACSEEGRHPPICQIISNAGKGCP